MKQFRIVITDRQQEKLIAISEFLDVQKRYGPKSKLGFQPQPTFDALLKAGYKLVENPGVARVVLDSEIKEIDNE